MRLGLFFQINEIFISSRLHYDQQESYEEISMGNDDPLANDFPSILTVNDFDFLPWVIYYGIGYDCDWLNVLRGYGCDFSNVSIYCLILHCGSDDSLSYNPWHNDRVPRNRNIDPQDGKDEAGDRGNCVWTCR